MAPETTTLWFFGTTTLWQQHNTKIHSSKGQLNCLFVILILTSCNSEIDYSVPYIGNTNDTSTILPCSDCGILDLRYYKGQKEPLQAILRQHYNLVQGSLLSHQDKGCNSSSHWLSRHILSARTQSWTLPSIFFILQGKQK